MSRDLDLCVYMESEANDVQKFLGVGIGRILAFVLDVLVCKLSRFLQV